MDEVVDGQEAEEPTSAATDAGLEVQSREPEEPTEEEVPRTKAPSKLQKLIDSKYGGDEDKFADGIFESWNSASRLHDEVRQLRQELAAKQAPPPPPLEDHPDYQWLNSEVKAIEEDKAQNQQVKERYTKVYRELETELAVLKATNAPVAERRAIESQMITLSERYEDKEREDRRLDRQRAQLTRQLEAAKTQLMSSRERQEYEKQQTVQEVQGYRQHFDNVVMGLLADSGLPQDEQAEYYDLIRGKAELHIEKNGPVADIGRLGADIASRYIQLVKRQNFQAISEAKAQVASKTASSAPVAKGSVNTSTKKATLRSGEPTAASVKNLINEWIKR